MLGAAGRTGREVLRVAMARGHEVVAFSRKPFVAAVGVSVKLGDALDAGAVADAIFGCDALICVVGPAPGAPANQDSRLAEVLMFAMRSAGVKRLALVTGALQAASRSLGWFSRRLARLRSVRALVDDRHRLEQRLLASNLEVTILSSSCAFHTWERSHRVEIGSGSELEVHDLHIADVGDEVNGRHTRVA